MDDLKSNVATLLRLISRYEKTGDIQEHNAELLESIGAQIGTDCRGNPATDSPPAPAAAPMEIFTDGGCSPNPGCGGWAAVIVQSGQVIKRLSGGEPHATNNQMEFRAAIEALKWLDPDRPATIYSDSRLVVEILMERWTPKKNLELVDEAKRLVRERKVKFYWVRGHSGNHFNEEADALAGRAIPASRQKKRRVRRL